MPYNREGNPKLLRIDGTSDATVTHGPTSVTMLQLKPEVGFLYEVISIFAEIPDPVGSTAGTHKLEFFPTARTSLIDEFIEVVGNTGTNIAIRDSAGLVGDTEIPLAITQQENMMHRVMWASNDWPIDIKYTNSTDVDQTGTRELFVLVKVWREAI